MKIIKLKVQYYEQRMMVVKGLAESGYKVSVKKEKRSGLGNDVYYVIVEGDIE